MKIIPERKSGQWGCIKVYAISRTAQAVRTPAEAPESAGRADYKSNYFCGMRRHVGAYADRDVDDVLRRWMQC